MARCGQKSTKSAEWRADRNALDVKAGRFEKGRRRWYLGRLLLKQARFGGRLFRTSSVTWARGGGGRTSGTYLQLRAQKPLSAGSAATPRCGGGMAPSPRCRSGSLPRGSSRPECSRWAEPPLPDAGPRHIQKFRQSSDRGAASSARERLENGFRSIILKTFMAYRFIFLSTAKHNDVM